MTIERSDLNKPGALRDGTQASRKGARGDGNSPSAEALEAGFARVDDPDRAPRWMTSGAADLGLDGFMGMDTEPDTAGFLGRPHGYER